MHNCAVKRVPNKQARMYLALRKAVFNRSEIRLREGKVSAARERKVESTHPGKSITE